MKINKYLAIFLMAIILFSCKKQENNIGKLAEGKQPGITYVPLATTLIDSKSKITFTADLVSMDGIKEVNGYFIEVLAINSFGNPSSEGNKFFIGTNKFNNKETNTIFDGAVTVKYEGQDRFKTGNKNEHSKYTLNGTLDLSKYKLVPGKRYRLSINFISFGNQNTLESPFLFLLAK